MTYYSQPAGNDLVLSPAYNDTLEYPYNNILGEAYLGNTVLGLEEFVEIRELTENVEQTITFTDEATVVHQRGTNNTITFSQQVTFVAVYNRSISQTLDLQQTFGVVGTYNKSFNQSINLQQFVNRVKVLPRSTSNSITFSDSVLAEVVKLCTNNLEFNFEARIVGWGKKHTDILTFTQTISLAGSIRSKSLNNTLSLSQAVSLAGSTYNKSLSNNITFSQQVAVIKVHNKSINQSISLTQDVHRTYPISIAQNITFAQSHALTKVLNKAVSQELSFVNNVSRTIIYNRSLSNTINFQHGKTVLNGLYSIPGAQALTEKSYFKLQAKNAVILLPNPKFGNSEALNANLNLMKAIDGTTYTYIRQTSTKRMVYEFDVDDTKAEEMRNFIVSSSSELVQLTWRDQIWVGYIDTNPLQIRATSRKRREFDLEFEGVQVF